MLQWKWTFVTRLTMQKLKEDRWSCKRLKENNVKYQKQMITNYGNSTCKMKQQQKHDIKGRENSEESESQMGFEPTTLRDQFGCSNFSTGTASRCYSAKLWLAHMNSLIALRCHIKAYRRLRVVTLSLSPCRVTRKKTVKKMAAWNPSSPFHSVIFFRGFLSRHARRTKRKWDYL